MLVVSYAARADCYVAAPVGRFLCIADGHDAQLTTLTFGHERCHLHALDDIEVMYDANANHLRLEPLFTAMAERYSHLMGRARWQQRRLDLGLLHCL